MGVNGHPLNLQYAGEPRALTDTLQAHGWRTAETLSFDNAIRLLSPSLQLMELPLIPHVHDGRHEDLSLVKSEGEDGRLVLRLWATPYRIDGRRPLWIGNVTAQHKRLILGLLAMPATGAGTSPPSTSASSWACWPGPLPGRTRSRPWTPPRRTLSPWPRSDRRRMAPGCCVDRNVTGSRRE